MVVFALLVLMVVILEPSECQIGDPCQIYKQVPDIFRRLEQYTLTADEHQVNDYYLDEGWYGENGFDMLLEAPQSATACGTLNPIYLQGTLPENVGDRVNRMACVIGWTGNCIVQLPVEVKRCTDTLNVYYLRSSTIVLSAYCFTRAGMNGTIAPAPNFNPTFVKVEVDAGWTEPIVTPRATIQFPLMVFSCSFSPVPDNLYFLITWFVGDLRIKKGPVKKENITDLVINDIDLKNIGVTKLGFIVKCGVTALADATGMPGNMKVSDGFFAGIKIQTPRIELKRGQTAQVALYSTVPYGCAHVINVPGRVDNCPGNIETFYTRGTSCKSAFGVVDSQGRRRRSAHRCGVQLRETKFNDVQPGVKTNWTQRYIWTIEQTDDGTYQLTERLFRVKLRVSEGTQHAIWNGYELDDIIVTVKDQATTTWQRKTCRATCDPHMTTFDGSPYEMQKPGVYTLYKHKTSPVEVQLQSEPCIHGVAHAHCPCGVYIRGGSDIYIISTCTRHPFIDFLHCGDRSLQVLRNGDRTYKIILPTGAMVTVNTGYRWQLNVYINAAPRDLNNVEGLCGNINGNRNDDFIVNGRNFGAVTICGGGFRCRNQFIDLYKLSAEKRFFPPTAENKNLFQLSPDQIVCTCPLDVAHGVAKSECSTKAFVKCKANREKQLKCTETNLRRKRDIEERLLYIQDHLEKFSKALTRRKRSVTAMTITTDQARLICQAKFNNAGSYQYCQSNVAGIQNTQEIENCIFDLNVTGITDWAQDALATVTQQCTHEAEKNTTLQTSNNGAPSIAEVIEEITCPNECSGNGDCRNGTCFCNEEFTGSDCSFKRRQAPIVHPDVGDKVCNKSEGPCNQISIFGEDFIDSANLTCRIKEYQMSVNGTVLRESSISVHGDARSPFEVRCPITRFRRRRQTSQTNGIVFFQKYVIAIANDGTLFGIEKDVYVADSTCQIQTNISNIFQVKAGYCFIDGKCVAKGDSLETDRHKVCLPANETFHWTHVETIAPVITEPCQIYKEIPDLLRRLESYQPSANEEQINDYFLEEGWYGKPGYDMLQRIPENATACGTISPVWLQGSLPDSIGTNVTASACVTGWLPGCILDIPVDIKNCSSILNVYYLRPSAVALTGYCFVMSKLIMETTTKQLTTTTPPSTTTVQVTSTSTTSTLPSTVPTETITTTTTMMLTTSQSINPSTTEQPITPPITSTSNTPSKGTKKPDSSSTPVFITTTRKSNGDEEGQQGKNYLWVIAVVVVVLVVIIVIIAVAVFVTKRSKSRTLQPDHDTSRIIDKDNKDDLPVESDPPGETEPKEGEKEDTL